ncbi:MAG: hypothetical protein Unbinned5079contig1000_17 [Prokaryotic dsDNA virus sp.]|nr:MAG: hypothetical protein Unbinned5079contig1000_17 [Prokaryotic dsDNA virus sp.]
MKLRHYIRQNKLTQTKFAHKCGLSKATVSRIIAGERQPSLRVMQIIYRATEGKVTPDDFFTD